MGSPTGTVSTGSRTTGTVLVLRTPAVSYTVIRQRAAIALKAHDRTGAAITFVASGLPSGLTISPTSGRITGVTVTPGRYPVKITVTSPHLAATQGAFLIVVEGTPRLTGVTLTGVTADEPKLTFEVSRGADAKGLQMIALRLPFGVSLAQHGAALSPYVKVRSPSGQAIPATVSTTRGRIGIVLHSVVSAATVTITAPGVKAGARLVQQVKAGTTRLSFPVAVKDASGALSALLTRALAS